MKYLYPQRILFIKLIKKLYFPEKEKRGVYLLLFADRIRQHNEASKKSVFSVN